MAAAKYNVTCVFEDGATARFTSSTIETVYQAALRSGLPLETDCREGACGVCKAFRSDGDGDIGDVSDEALTDDEQEQGFVLCCQYRAQSDLVLEFGYPLSLLKKETATIDAVVAEVEPVADNVVRLVLTTDAEAPAFLPGQYVNISVPDAVSGRSYSFANPPSEPDRMEFFVRILEQGEMSNYLRDAAKAGDAVKLQGPFGQFFLRTPRAGRIVMIAGGTGLAPMLSMLSELERGEGERPRVTLLYGANHPGELFGKERIEAYGDWVDLRTIVVSGNDDWSGPTGFVTDLLAQGGLDDAALTDAYLCGPPPMIDAAREALTGLGVPAARVFAEKFLPSAS
ncbi:MAG: 2Fe-2S iron-sulfur cluster binding domain-containing protein [Aquisalimonadaceae bacterium]